MRGPGLAPAGDSLSFASPKESKPRKSDPAGCVPSLRCGQPAVLSFAGVSLNSRRFASLKQTRALIRQNLRSSAHPEGNPKPDIHTGHRFARPKPPGRKRHALRRLGRAQQWPVWMLGCSFLTPFWLRLRRGGCGVSMGVGAPMPRALTRRGCPSGARSAKRVPRRTPQPPRRRFAPSHREGVADWGSPFFWVLFFGEAKKSTSPAGAKSRLPPLAKACSQKTGDESDHYEFNSYQRFPHKHQSQIQSKPTPHPTPATPHSPAPTAATAA